MRKKILISFLLLIFSNSSLAGLRCWPSSFWHSSKPYFLTPEQACYHASETSPAPYYGGAIVYQYEGRSSYSCRSIHAVRDTEEYITSILCTSDPTYDQILQTQIPSGTYVSGGVSGSSAVDACKQLADQNNASYGYLGTSSSSGCFSCIINSTTEEIGTYTNAGDVCLSGSSGASESYLPSQICPYEPLTGNGGTSDLGSNCVKNDSYANGCTVIGTASVGDESVLVSTGSVCGLDTQPIDPCIAYPDAEGCSSNSTDGGSTDGGTDSGSTSTGTDGGSTGGGTDGGSTDSGTSSGSTDGSTDSGSTDSGTSSGSTDGSTDSGSTDGGTSSGSTGGSTDSGSTDSGTSGGSTGGSTDGGSTDGNTGNVIDNTMTEFCLNNPTAGACEGMSGFCAKNPDAGACGGIISFCEKNPDTIMCKASQSWFEELFSTDTENETPFDIIPSKEVDVGNIFEQNKRPGWLPRDCPVAPVVSLPYVGSQVDFSPVYENICFYFSKLGVVLLVAGAFLSMVIVVNGFRR